MVLRVQEHGFGGTGSQGAGYIVCPFSGSMVHPYKHITALLAEPKGCLLKCNLTNYQIVAPISH